MQPSDYQNDRRSVNRALVQSLYLLVRKKGEKAWSFPQGVLKPTEHIRQVSPVTTFLVHDVISPGRCPFYFSLLVLGKGAERAVWRVD